jgi:hypothetical protein
MNPLRVYLAARYSRRTEMQTIGETLTRHGVDVTSRWITGCHEGLPEATCAEDDLADIDRAQGILLFTETPAVGYMSGGRMVGLGYAIGKRKWVWIVGPRENVFCHLGHCGVYATISEWMAEMLEEPKSMRIFRRP